MIMSTSHAPHGQKFDPENTTTSVRFDLAPDTTFDLPPPKARTIHDPDLAPHVEYITHDEQPIDLEFVSPVSGKDPNRKPDPNRLIGTGTEPPPKPQAEVRLEGEQWDLDMQVLDKMSEKVRMDGERRTWSEATASAVSNTSLPRSARNPLARRFAPFPAHRPAHCSSTTSRIRGTTRRPSTIPGSSHVLSRRKPTCRNLRTLEDPSSSSLTATTTTWWPSRTWWNSWTTPWTKPTKRCFTSATRLPSRGP